MFKERGEDGVETARGCVRACANDASEPRATAQLLIAGGGNREEGSPGEHRG